MGSKYNISACGISHCMLEKMNMGHTKDIITQHNCRTTVAVETKTHFNSLQIDLSKSSCPEACTHPINCLPGHSLRKNKNTGSSKVIF